MEMTRPFVDRFVRILVSLSSHAGGSGTSMSLLGKRRSHAQKEHSFQQMAKLHTGNKENLDPEPSGNKVLLDSTSDSALKCECVRALDFKRKLHNEHDIDMSINVPSDSDEEDEDWE